jgi:diguanylate cyclase (GGDEF)-like protein
MLVAVSPSQTAASDPAPRAAAQLAQAEALRLTDNAAFVRLLRTMDAGQTSMTAAQRWHLKYLHGWQDDYQGDHASAVALFRQILAQCPDATLRFRARATLINVLDTTRQFEPAYRELDQLMRDLPGITDPAVRYQGLGEASMLLNFAGQFDLAEQMARQMFHTVPPGQSVCVAQVRLLDVLVLAARIKADDPRFAQGIDACLKDHQVLVADVIRIQHVDVLMREGRLPEALHQLLTFHDEVIGFGYAQSTVDWDSTLARALYRAGRYAEAARYASEGLPKRPWENPSGAIAKSYRVLYQVAKKQGDMATALAWHEQYMDAEKRQLDAASASSLAYQRVRQEVAAKERALQESTAQNRILQLQQALDRKAMQTSRLSIILLLTVLASVVFWLVRLSRSHKRYVRLARHDGLTGIFNRQHFVEQAEQMLATAQREGNHLCLLLMDLDHFKLINDAHGHGFGDLVLKRAVAVCHDHLRKSDIFGRLGGEEFGILLPDCALANASARAEAIRITIAETSDDEDTRGVMISASLGVASTEHSGYDLQQLMADADNALYRAKRGGRNRVVLDVVELDERAAS